MEAKERTELPEVNGVPIKKPVNVLEALAKYNLKKQQEQERNMTDTSEDKKKRDIIDLERRLSLEHVKATKSQHSVTTHTVVNKRFNPKHNMLFGPTKQHMKKINDIKRLKTTKSTNFKENKQVTVNKVFTKKLPMSNYSYLKNVAVNQQENGTYLKHECEVGITEFVSQCQGFSANMGHNFFDIQVHEICIDGSIVHLTTKHSPGSSFFCKRYPTEEEQLAVLTAEQWNTIEDMLKTEKPEIVEIDVTGKSKGEKKKIGRILKMKYDDIDNNNTASADGKTIMKIFKKRKRNRQEPKDQQGNKSNYTQFVLYKENQTTMEALNTIAQKLKMEAECFMTAGTKDKKAITSQLVTVKNVEPHLLFHSVKYNASISLGNFTYTEHPLRSDNLRGNRFTIALKNVIGDECTILTNLNSLKEMGFINYYEPQRFGTRHIPRHFIGKQLILGNWKEAINLVLEPGNLNGHPYYPDIAKAVIEYKSTKDAQKAFGKITRNFQAIEAKLLLNLSKCGEDFVGALNTISRNIRVMYMRAYQCFIWNTIASKRLATFGLQPIIGDLVYAPNNSECFNSERKPLIEMVGDKDNCGKNGKGHYRKVIYIDEKNIHKYTIHDVVLPLPGWQTVYPANQSGVWYREFLQAEGLSDMDFSRSFKMFNLSGIYRFMVSKPFDVKWRFVHYDDPNAILIQSDKNRLKNKAQRYPVMQGSTYQGLVLEFNLSAFTFASMAIREITKMDMTTECRAKFKGTRERSQNLESQSLAEVDRCQDQSESCKSSECPATAIEMEQINETPVVNNQQTLTTESSCIEHEFELNLVQPGPSQSSPVPASMLPEEPLTRTIKFEPGQSKRPPPIPQTSAIKEEPGISTQTTSGIKDRSEQLDFINIWMKPVASRERHPAYKIASQKSETEIIKKEEDVSKEPRPTGATRFVVERNNCQISQQEVNDRWKNFLKKRTKEEPDRNETAILKVGKSPEEPEKKRIKVELVPLQDRPTVTKMPSNEPKKEPIIFVDLTSDQED